MNKKYSTETNVSSLLLEDCHKLSKVKFTPEYINEIESKDEFIKELSYAKKFDSFYKLLADDLSKKAFIKIVKYRYILSFSNEISGNSFKEILFSIFYPTSNYLKWLLKILKFYLLQKHTFYKEIKVSPFTETSLISECNIKDIFEIKDGDIVFDINSINLGSIYELSKKLQSSKIYAIDSKKEKLKNLTASNISAHNIILSNLEEEANSLSAVKILNDNENNIKTITLDHFVRKQKIERVDVIKINSCGREKFILEGAKNTIKKLRPKIAVSLYDKDNISFDVFELLKSMTPNYKYYLRVYTPFAKEAILYCIPENTEVL